MSVAVEWCIDVHHQCRSIALHVRLGLASDLASHSPCILARRAQVISYCKAGRLGSSSPDSQIFEVISFGGRSISLRAATWHLLASWFLEPCHCPRMARLKTRVKRGGNRRALGPTCSPPAELQLGIHNGRARGPGPPRCGGGSILDADYQRGMSGTSGRKTTTVPDAKRYAFSS
jgi:hypothetical protein